MATPKEHKAKGTQRRVMGEKANESPQIYAAVGDGGGTVATGRANFYYIRLRGDDNRVTECYSLVPLADGDLVYVRQSQDRKLRYYEFVEFIQAAGGGTGPPVPYHAVLGPYHSDAATAAIAQGDVLIGDATPEVNRLAIGNAHEIFKVNAGGTDPAWEPFDWDEMATPVGADMVHDHSTAGEGGQNLHQIQELEFDDATILTIDVNGTITRTQAYHVVAANAGVADNLDQIDGGVEGDILIILADTGDTITVRHNQGGAGDNIWLAGGADIDLDNDDHLMLIFDGTWWCDVSGGAGGGALPVHDHNDALSGGDDLNPETLSSQGYLVGPSCVYTTLGAAIAAVNAAGPPALGTEYTITLLAGTFTEVADVTIPGYCTVKGAGENTIVAMGGFTLYMSDNASLLDLVVTGSDTGTIEINNADCILRNVRAVNDGTGAYCIYIYGDSDCKLYDVVVESSLGVMNYGFFISNTATVLLVDCVADDSTNFNNAALCLSDTACTASVRGGKYRGAGDDIWAGSASTLYHLGVDFRPANSTFNGAHTAEPTKRFNQWLIVAKEGGDFQLLSDAVSWINTQGDNASGKRYGILMAAGNYTEAGDVTIPDYVGVCGHDTRLDMATFTLLFRDSCYFEGLNITSGDASYTVTNAIGYGGGTIFVDCRVYNTHATTGDALVLQGFTGTVYAYGSLFDSANHDAVLMWTSAIVTITLVADDCRFEGGHNGLDVDSQHIVYTHVCQIVGGTDDVNLASGATWYPHLDQVDWGNCTLSGTVSVRLTTPIAFGDDAWIGLGAAAGRIVFDSTATPDEVVIYSANVGIGASPGAGRHLYVYDAAVDTTVTYAGIYASHTKTAGASDENDSMYGIFGEITINQAGGTVGTTAGLYGKATATAGSVGTAITNRAINALIGYAVMDGGTVEGNVYAIQAIADCDTGTITGNVQGLRVNVDIEAGMTSIGGNVYGAYILVDDDEGAAGTVYMLFLAEQTGIDYGIYQSGTADNAFGGHILPTGNKAKNLGAAANRWNTLYQGTSTAAGTSRLVDSRRDCPVCGKKMKRGTGSLLVLGEHEDYALAHCLHCGAVAMETMKHLPEDRLARRQPPPKVEFVGFHVFEMSGSSRQVRADFRYTDDVVEKHGDEFEHRTSGITNATYLGEDEIEAFLGMSNKQRKAFLQELGEREWYALEEVKLMQEQVGELQAQLDGLTTTLKGRNLN